MNNFLMHTIPPFSGRRKISLDFFSKNKINGTRDNSFHFESVDYNDILDADVRMKINAIDLDGINF